MLVYGGARVAGRVILESWNQKQETDNEKLHLGLAAHLGEPPAQADEEEAWVVEELGPGAFEGVSDELEDPSENEKDEAVEFQMMSGPEEAGGGDKKRDDNDGNADGMAETVDLVLMSG